MKLKKVIATGLAAACALSLAACGSTSGSSSSAATETKKDATETKSDGTDETKGGSTASGDVATVPLDFGALKLGEDEKDLTAEIKFLTNRTDMAEEGYNGKSWDQYLEDFNKMYPNIKVNVEAVTNYAEDSLLRLQGSDWGDIMMIPAVDKSEYSNYFLSYGDVDSVSKVANYVSDAAFDGQVYGIPCTAATRGIVYNKKVWTDAGIVDADGKIAYPKTPDEFIADLQKIKDNCEGVVPLYDNYHEDWAMAAWDDYIGFVATGDSKYMNQTLVHTAEPFKDPGDGTGAYNVYKILYDAASKGLTEDDYVNSDWESCKGKINNGEIGCMVLGSWAYSQMVAAGDHGADIGYMPFPITINGEYKCPASPDYKFAINKNSSEDNQKAAEIFVKWMTCESGYSFNEGGLPIAADSTEYPDTYKEFSDLGITFVPDEPSLEGEETFLVDINSESELNVCNGGGKKIQAIVDAAKDGDSFDDLMAEWNQKWSDAQKAKGIEQK